MITAIALLILLYFVPGFFTAILLTKYTNDKRTEAPDFSRGRTSLLKGKLRQNPFFWVFLSLLIVPFFYTLLISLKALNLESFVILNAVYAFLCLWINRRLNPDSKPNFDKILPPRKTPVILPLLAAIFFLLVMAPRLGLLKGHFPIGDDFRQIPKVVSIAASPNEPLFPYFPITRLTIYYFNNIAPGLLVRLTDNLVQAHQAWFIHMAICTIAMLWLIIKIGNALFKIKLSRSIFFFSLTFLSGLEYYLYLLKSPGNLDQLEWWTDWFFPPSQIHLQTTNPYNLFFWVPQHLFAAILVLLLFLILRSDQKDKLLTKIFLGIVWANILGSSAFVFLSTAVVYVIYTVIEVIKKKKVLEILKFNLPVVLIAIGLSLKNLELFLTSEKGQHFVQMGNVFWFLPNFTLLGKLVNFSLTIPLYYLVELGILLPILLWALYQFIKDKNFRQKYLFFYLFIFLWPAIFVVKTTGDNNIALRTFIPAQIALALFAAELTERCQKRKLFYPLLIVGILISLPSGLWYFNQHFKGQIDLFKKEREALYQTVDEELPLNSIVFSSTNEAGNMVVLGHRFTFKPLAQFTSTDKEYSTRSQIEPYADLDLSKKEDILKIMTENPQLPENFSFYFRIRE